MLLSNLHDFIKKNLSFFLFLVLEIEPKALHILNKLSVAAMYQEGDCDVPRRRFSSLKLSKKRSSVMHISLIISLFVKIPCWNTNIEGQKQGYDILTFARALQFDLTSDQYLLKASYEVGSWWELWALLSGSSGWVPLLSPLSTQEGEHWWRCVSQQTQSDSQVKPRSQMLW